jgi:LacI family transcriptional regulator
MGKKFKNKDLAEKLGVSSTLVSLVLNNKADQQGIRKDTQEKVLFLARKMGFFDSEEQKDEIPAVEEKPGILGMIVPSLNDPFVIQIAPFLQKAFSGIGVGFSIVTKDPDDQRYDRLLAAFKKFYSGLILFGDTADDGTIRALRSSDYPFVVLEKPVRTLRLNTVYSDIHAGVSLVADHIDKLEYKNVIIISDRKSFRIDPTVVHDIVGTLTQKTGMNQPVVIELNNHVAGEEIDFGQLEKFLRPPFRADVMIIMNASLVYQIMAFVRKNNVRIPQDIALISMEEGIGFDLMFPTVTCLRRPLPGMSVKIANMLWSEVKNSGKGKFKRQVNILPELIVRNSCGTI